MSQSKPRCSSTASSPVGSLGPKASVKPASGRFRARSRMPSIMLVACESASIRSRERKSWRGQKPKEAEHEKKLPFPAHKQQKKEKKPLPSLEPPPGGFKGCGPPHPH